MTVVCVLCRFTIVDGGHCPLCPAFSLKVWVDAKYKVDHQWSRCSNARARKPLFIATFFCVLSYATCCNSVNGAQDCILLSVSGLDDFIFRACRISYPGMTTHAHKELLVNHMSIDILTTGGGVLPPYFRSPKMNNHPLSVHRTGFAFSTSFTFL